MYYTTFASAGTCRPHSYVFIALFLLLNAGSLGAQTSVQSAKTPSKSSPAAKEITVQFVAALVLADMTVRPLPLLGLELIDESDTTRRVSFRTGLDGKANQVINVGKYRVASTSDITVEGNSYRWDFPVVVNDRTTTIELTNVNAVVKAQQVANAPAQKNRQVAPEREVFEKVKRGVFRVEAGLGHGSGFFVDTLGGVVVTNDHVVGTASFITVYIDSLTRVPAQVIVRNREADLAVLRLPKGRCADCPRLKLAQIHPGEPLVVAGERLLAIGFPLTQELTLTSGIVSSLRDGAIMSDVAINPGNSGGPMLNLNGEVVGINTFGDKDQRVGQGISGSISVQRLGPLFANVPVTLAKLPALEDKSLPPMTLQTYSMSLLKSMADTASLVAYRKLTKDKPAGNFSVGFMTPVLFMVQQKTIEAEVSKDRKKREKKAGIATQEQYTEMGEIRDWLQYVGSETAPVIAVQVTPQIGETFGSALGRALVSSATYGASTLKATMKFRGDVREVKFYRNGVEITPLRGGHAPQKFYINEQWVELKDVADMGYYILPPDAVLPDSGGIPPKVHIVIQDLKNPKELAITNISGDVTARLWNDFVPFFESQMPGQAIERADPKKKSPKIEIRCTVASIVCEIEKED